MDGAVPSEIAENNLAYAEKSAENESENAKIAESKNARSISGDFESGRGLSGRSARTAFPSINESSLYYTVSATSGSKRVQGEVEQSGKFTIKLSSGTWTVKAEGYSDSARNTKILEGTSGSFQINTNSVKNDISITLSPISSGNGSVSLPISVAADSGIQSAIVKIFEDVGETKQITVNTTLEYDFSTTKDATISASVTAGSRYFVFTFYSVNLTAAKQNPNQNIAYQAHETVNVFQNLTTDTWSGSTSYLSGTGTNKKFEITKTLADTFNRKEFYVQGTSETTYTPTTTASDDNSGTYFDPLATLGKALKTINAINDGISAYTIKVDGTLTITSQSATSAVVIQPEKNLNLTIESHSTAKATIQANSNGMRVFIVGNGALPDIKPNVTMKNLIIIGGNNETGGGAGIKLEAGNLTLSNVEVKDNKTTDVGGGICVGTNASITLDGCTVSNNSADSGGGIYIESGTCTINGGAISNNKAASKGGGVCVAVLGSSITITGTTTMSGNQLTGQQETGTAIFVGRGATAELDGSSGNINITQGIAPGGALPTIYLEKGQRGSLNSGGSGGSSAIPDAVLKLGGQVQIGNGNGTGIKMEKTFRDTANIKITSGLTSTTTIPLDLFPFDQSSTYDTKPIIEGESYNLTSEDCSKFIVTSGNTNYKLELGGSKNQGICSNAD